MWRNSGIHDSVRIVSGGRGGLRERKAGCARLVTAADRSVMRMIVVDTKRLR